MFGNHHLLSFLQDHLSAQFFSPGKVPSDVRLHNSYTTHIGVLHVGH